jgi:hypothetical protein
MLLGTTSTLGSAGLETVVESSVDFSDVLHAAGTGGSSSESLLAPVDCSREKIVRKYSGLSKSEPVFKTLHGDFRKAIKSKTQ